MEGSQQLPEQEAPLYKTVLDALGIKITEATKEHVRAEMPIEGRHLQPFGYLHGGVSALLAETVASVASGLHIDWTSQAAFGLEINANHLRPKREGGTLFAQATPLHLGRSTHVWDIRIKDECDKLICVSRCTVVVVNQRADGAK